MLARKDELEDALVDLRRGDALERQANETALVTVYALMTGDIAHPSDMVARDAIAVRIAQPVRAMLRLDQQLMALDPRARVIGRPRPDQLRPWQRRSRIVVVAAMLDDDAHAAFLPPTRAMG